MSYTPAVRGLLLAAACAVASAAGAAAGADLPEVIDRGVLRVIVASDEAPETFALAPSPTRTPSSAT